ncbi:MAG TPA: acyl-CoA acyltransferase [Xanthobacteraceae bacterium]|jgi:hypothetical protein|nr:acyl-CoA acyltransferase [Xanthobacteraceae bacterium]
MLDSPKTIPRVRFRQIADSDVNDVVELLARGFATRRSRPFWQNAMARLAAHATPPGAPRYGYMLDAGSGPVGVVLMISSTPPADDGARLRSNVSSWYVEPAFRSYASMLVSQAIRHKDVTYVNLTPVPHTLPILQAHGYTCYARGVFIAALPLQIFARAPRTRIVPADATPLASYAAFERQVLRDHAGYGCVGFWCESEERAYPFVFRLRTIKGIPGAQLVYCRDAADCVRFIGPLARYLTLRGRPLLVIDANGPIPGLAGKYFDQTMPRFFRGPQRPRLGDLAYTEIAMFGV